MMELPEVGFVRAKILGTYIYSCYAPQNMTIAQYEERVLVSDENLGDLTRIPIMYA